jgi:hypothetical protein
MLKSLAVLLLFIIASNAYSSLHYFDQDPYGGRSCSIHGLEYYDPTAYRRLPLTFGGINEDAWAVKEVLQFTKIQN